MKGTTIQNVHADIFRPTPSPPLKVKEEEKEEEMEAEDNMLPSHQVPKVRFS